MDGQMKYRFAGRALFLIAVLALASSGRASLPTVRPNLDIMTSAHRGALMSAPENTLPAIRKAIELGYDYVEIDVRYTMDGVPVLMHDDWVNRTTNGFGPVGSYSLARLKKLDAGFWYGPGFWGTRVPTVEEAFQVMQGKIKLYLDQKEPPRPELIRLVKDYGFYPHNMVVVGGGENTVKFLEFLPEAPAMPKLRSADQVDELIEQFPTAPAVNSDCEYLTPEIVDAAHSRGLLVFTNVLHMYPWRTRECMKKPIIMGSDVVQFDNLDLFLEVKKEIADQRER